MRHSAPAAGLYPSRKTNPLIRVQNPGRKVKAIGKTAYHVNLLQSIEKKRNTEHEFKVPPPPSVKIKRIREVETRQATPYVSTSSASKRRNARIKSENFPVIKKMKAWERKLLKLGWFTALNLDTAREYDVFLALICVIYEVGGAAFVPPETYWKSAPPDSHEVIDVEVEVANKETMHISNVDIGVREASRPRLLSPLWEDCEDHIISSDDDKIFFSDPDVLAGYRIDRPHHMDGYTSYLDKMCEKIMLQTDLIIRERGTFKMTRPEFRNAYNTTCYDDQDFVLHYRD